VYILLLNSCVKFHAKNLHALLKYQQKSPGGKVTFYVELFYMLKYVAIARLLLRFSGVFRVARLVSLFPRIASLDFHQLLFVWPSCLLFSADTLNPILTVIGSALPGESIKTGPFKSL